MSYFSYVSEVPPDRIFGLTAEFLKDPRESKINLGIGVYKTEDLKTPILSCVKQAERSLLEKQISKNYLPVEGDTAYLEAVGNLIFGEKLYQENVESLSSVQTIGGSGGLRLGGDFLEKSSSKVIYTPTPTWLNHHAIFAQSGLEAKSYPYYDATSKGLMFSSMMDSLSELPEESIILLHVNCHNPSGVDLTKEQWSALADLCIKKKLIAFFDAAYLGFDQSVEEDAYPIRLFMEKKIEFLLSISFSKNLSLYAERVGAFFLFSNPSCSKNITSLCRMLTRRNYSNPPLHGAHVVTEVLTTPLLKELWEKELLEMKHRIVSMKKEFIQSLTEQGCRKDYSYLLETKGLFFFSGLSEEQVDMLRKEHGIYITSDGRINIAGLNQESLVTVACAIVKVGG